MEHFKVSKGLQDVRIRELFSVRPSFTYSHCNAASRARQSGPILLPSKAREFHHHHLASIIELVYKNYDRTTPFVCFGADFRPSYPLPLRRAEIFSDLPDCDPVELVKECFALVITLFPLSKPIRISICTVTAKGILCSNSGTTGPTPPSCCCGV